MVQHRTEASGSDTGTTTTTAGSSSTPTPLAAADAQQESPTSNSPLPFLLQLFLEDTPLLDVRAPVEFNKGAFPTSVNIPILDSEQRALVGTCYTEEGQDAAIRLGRELMTPELQQQRLQDWMDHIEKHPQGYMYCFRGGLRSRLAHLSLKELTGVNYPIVPGGYKAMRTFLMENMEQNVQELPVVLIGGRTACGKTTLLLELERHVDLEGLANHKGSTFGKQLDPQPAQIDFENSLAIEFIKLRQVGKLPVFIEAEGNRVGDRVLPLSLNLAMTERYPIIELEIPMAERVLTCIKDYVTDAFPRYETHYGGPALAHKKFQEKYLSNFDRLKNRLGGARHKKMRAQVEQALVQYEKDGDESGFYEPTETILGEYYDRMYDHQASKRKGEILFRGDRQAVIEFAEQYAAQF